MEQTMITLTINNYCNDEYQFSFPSISGGVMSAFPATIELATRQTITAPYRMAASPRGASLPDFTAAGRLIYSHFPDDVQEYLNTNKDYPLLFQTNDATVPWELSHDNDTFLGLSRSIGRIMILPTPIRLREKSGWLEQSAKPSVLIIANPARDDIELNLPEADIEAEALSEFLLQKGCRVNVLAGKFATRFSVMAHLQGAYGTYDIIHYAGHTVLGKAKNKAHASLVLADGPLHPSEIMRLLRGSPIVFLNACHTINAGGSQPDVSSTSYSMGSDNSRDLGHAFILGNSHGTARALIGTLFRNNDTRSRELALACYHGLLNGESIGEALRLARQQIYSPADVTWASYVLYGDPRLRLLPPSRSFVSTVPLPAEDEMRREEAKEFMGEPTVGNHDSFPSMEMLGDSAKQVLFYALRETGSSLLTTSHLFMGMATLENGYTRNFLRAQLCDPEVAMESIRKLCAFLTDALDFSGLTERIQKILGLALEYAKLELERPGIIEEKHLLQGFFEDGGGMTATMLTEQGIRMPSVDRREIIALPLFVDSAPSGEKGRSENSDMRGKDAFAALGASGRLAVEEAIREARSMGHTVLTTPHLFIGVLQRDLEGLGAIIKGYGINPVDLVRELRSCLSPSQASASAELVVTKRCYDIILLAEELAPQIEARHLSMAILMDGMKDPASTTLQILRHYRLDPSHILKALCSVSESTSADSVKDKSSTRILDSIGKDLTALARNGKLNPVIGKSKEIETISEILLRKYKPCPVLIGKAGVGKTAVVEGFAQKIAEGQVPESLRNVRLVEISIASLVAGTKYRGEFEERLQRLVSEVSKAGNIILFLDEIHMIIGAGGSRDGTMDAGNILKPALARGDIKCIGATTIEEYRRLIEPDAALERRFSPVMIGEPSMEDAIQILEGIRASFESYHKVIIPSETAHAAVKISCAGLPHRHLPDKAIDLLDQACARVQHQQGRGDAATGSQPTVTVRHLHEVLSVLTGVPAPVSLRDGAETGTDSLFTLETVLNNRVIGQQEAVATLVQAIGLSDSLLRESGRPLSVLMFMGSVGVGKTSLAKTFAEESGRELIKLDMTEYTERHQVAKLIGAPAGYIGHDREGFLTGKLRSHPHCVVLLDEMEKAHPEVNQLFLHLFEEGRITDAKGKTIEAQQAIFIMTSNISAKVTAKGSGRKIGFIDATLNDTGPDPREILKQSFSREFIDRIDRIVQFHNLQRQDIESIVRRLLDDTWTRLAGQHGVVVEEDTMVLDFLCDKGYAPKSGVRPLKRVIEEHIVVPLSQMILEGRLTEKRELRVAVRTGEVVFDVGSN